MDTLAGYGIVKFFMNSLLEGVFPLWDPFLYLGTPFYAIVVLGFFNPAIYVIPFLVLLGVNYESAYVAYLVVYFFVGVIGFYGLTKIIVKNSETAFWGMVVFLFSGAGAGIFTQSNMLLMLVPAVWFFLFLIRFARRYQPGDFLGIIFCGMMLATSYIPFHFLTLFLASALILMLVDGTSVGQFLSGVVRFIRQHFLLTIFCLIALGMAVTPLVLYRMADGSGEVVVPARHCSNKNIEDCLKDTLQGSSEMSYLDTAHTGGLAERVTLHSLFSHLDKFSYASDDFFYVPTFAYLLILIGFFARAGRALIVLVLTGLLIFMISLGEWTPVHKFLYEHIFYFKYFRNLFFFMAFLMPILILTAVIQFQEFLENGLQFLRKSWSLTAIFLLHGSFLFFLHAQNNILPATVITVLGSAVFLALLLYKKISPGSLTFKILLAVLILFEPIQVFSSYSGNAHAYKRDLPKTHQPLVFSYTRPVQNENNQSRPNHFRPYIKDFWYDMAMQDAPGPVEPKGAGALGRGVFYLSMKLDRTVWLNYVRHKFILYDHVRPWNNQEQEWPEFQTDLLEFNNTVWVEAPDEMLLNAFRASSSGEAEKILENSSSFQVVGFDPNHLKFVTNFLRDRFLVYTQSFHEGWKLNVNGKPQKIYKANFGFQGFWLPSGNNTVELQYQPRGGRKIYLLLWILCWMFFFCLIFVLSRETKGDHKENQMQPRIHNPASMWLGNRCAFVYACTILILLTGVNWNSAKKNRMRYLLGVFMSEDYKNFNDGILYFDRKVAVEPDNASAYAGLGLCYFNLGEYSKSIQAYKKAVALDPNRSVFQEQLAVVISKAEEKVRH